MENMIIVDSCCDMTDSMKKEMNITSVPLTMMLGKVEYADDDTLDLPGFMRDMKACQEKVGSASPSPYLYQEAIQKTGGEYIITLSDKLSGSYNNAMLGSKQAKEETGHCAHVFNSKSGTAGETLITIKLHEILQEGLPKERVIEAVHAFIDSMKTYFVLENHDNLQKNGRLSKVTASLVKLLNMKLVMGTDGEGSLALYEKVRGMRKALDHLLLFIEKSGKKLEGESVVLSHCNNQELAQELADKIRQRFPFKKVYVVPTGGLSSLYADDKGIVMAF